MTTELIQTGPMTFTTELDGPPDAPPVLLLHGFPTSRVSWTEVSAQLTTAGLRTIAPDQRGCSPGARPTDVSAYAIEPLVDDVLGLLDAIGVGSVHLVGHDWGSIVAWHLAIRSPQRVHSLTAVSVPHPTAFARAIRDDPAQQQASDYFGLFRQPGHAEEILLAEDARRLRAMYGDDVPTEQADAHVTLLSHDGGLTGALNWYRAMTSHLDEPPVKVPTTLIWGEDDPAITRGAVEHCDEFVDAPYRFVALAGVGHWVPEQAPEVIADEILRYAAPAAT